MTTRTVPRAIGMRPSTARVVANFVAFQTGWFASVLGGAHGLPWVGPVAAALIVAWHLRLADRPRTETRLIGIVALLGAAWDSVLVSMGWISYASGMVLPGTAPVWIVALWVLFATTLNVSLGWLKGRTSLAVLLGGIAGPLAYYGGMKLGAVNFPEPLPALTALALGWAVFMPFLTSLAARLDGVSAGQRGQ